VVVNLVCFVTIERMKSFFFFCIAWIQSWSVFALVNGQPLLGKPDLVRLEFNERDSICSGFFLSPSLIVTAAHCLYSWRDGSMAKLTGITSADERKLDLEVLELIPHPKYEKGWAAHDVAVIKVSNYSAFEGNFLIGDKDVPMYGRLIYFGAGKIDMEKKIYGRSSGEASYLALNSYIFGLGPSTSSEKGEGFASIASNDSGSPVIQKETGKVIAVASKSTAIDISGSFLPAVSISSSLEEKSNRDFLLNHMNQKSL
jgi:hypothetical protein